MLTMGDMEVMSTVTSITTHHLVLVCLVAAWDLGGSHNKGLLFNLTPWPPPQMLLL